MHSGGKPSGSGSSGTRSSGGRSAPPKEKGRQSGEDSDDSVPQTKKRKEQLREISAA